jgi:hypothetical protein
MLLAIAIAALALPPTAPFTIGFPPLITTPHGRNDVRSAGEWNQQRSSRPLGSTGTNEENEHGRDDVSSGFLRIAAQVQEHIGNDKWKDSYWTEFLEEFAVFLHTDVIEFTDNEIMDSVKVLMEREIRSTSMILDCGRDRPTFVGTMNGFGVSAAVANAAFRKYVEQQPTNGVSPPLKPPEST